MKTVIALLVGVVVLSSTGLSSMQEFPHRSGSEAPIWLIFDRFQSR